MKYIYLRTSDLAKLTGHNQYNSLESTVNEILSRNGIQDVYVPRSNIEASLVKLTQDQLSELKRELQIPDTTSLSSVEQIIRSTIVNQSLSSHLSEDQSKQLISDKVSGKPVLQMIEQGMKQDLRMKRGNVKESSNLDKIQSKTGKVIQERNSRMYVKQLHRTETYCLIVRGKVDGLSDGTIIESKNRTRRLFQTIREYEQVQLEGYMFLTGFTKALLTEHYNDTECCLDYTHDPVFWESCKDSIIEFIDTHIAPHITE